MKGGVRDKNPNKQNTLFCAFQIEVLRLNESREINLKRVSE
jgi:hypothetical protein